METYVAEKNVIGVSHSKKTFAKKNLSLLAPKK